MTGWHLDPELLARYAAGRANAVADASVDAHALSCRDCRTALSAYADPAVLDRSWDEIVDRLDTPRPLLLERLLRLALHPADARLVAVTPSLRGPWLLALFAAVAFAVVGADLSSRPPLPFLLVAPLVPVAGVAAAYGRIGDPAYELTLVTPYSALRLLLLRTVAVLVASLVLCGAGGVVAGDGLAMAWLLPALALTSATLALSTVVVPALAATITALSWAGALLIAYPDVDGPGIQSGSALLAVAAVVVIVARARRFEMGDVR